MTIQEVTIKLVNNITKDELDAKVLADALLDKVIDKLLEDPELTITEENVEEEVSRALTEILFETFVK